MDPETGHASVGPVIQDEWEVPMPAPASVAEDRTISARKPPHPVRRAFVALVLGVMLGLVTALLQPRRRQAADLD